MKAIVALLLVAFVPFSQSAQEKPHVVPDTTRFLNTFKKARIELRARSVYMHSLNQGVLTDAQAWAAGIGVGIVTKNYRGFEAGLSAYSIYNLWSTDLLQPDPVTQMPNRYEVGLFDLQNPSKKLHLLRLENLYLRYHRSKTDVTLGKMKVNSPFLNPQDGRMNTTLAEGVWVQSSEWKNLSIGGGFIWRISPRSTMQWYSVGNSFGLYPMGVTTTGARSAYLGNIQNCHGIALAQIGYKAGKTVKLQAWNMLVTNVVNSTLIEITNEGEQPNHFYQGLLYIHQNAVNAGGNSNQALTYLPRKAQANVISAQAGFKNKRFNGSFSYTHITGDGRYLMPREWGRDPMYTFMLRERNEGFGNLHAFVGKTIFQFFNSKLKTSLAYGIFVLPDVKNYRLNKYGMPSYHQLNADISYSFNKFMKGMELRTVAAYKLNRGNTYNDDRFVYNKVNMVNVTVIADFKL